MGKNMKFSLAYLLMVAGLFWFIGCGGTEQNQGNAANAQAAQKIPQGKDGKNKRPGNPGGQAMSATPVEVSLVIKGDIANYLLFSSSVETEFMTDIYPKISGEIVEIFYDEGRFVKKGTTIVKVDDREYKIQAERARVNYEQLKSETNRLTRLKEKDLVSVEEYDKAKFAMEQAKLDWELAQLNLEYTNIKAPFDGVITERFVRVGDRVNNSTKICTFTNLSEKIVVVYVPQNDIAKVVKNQEAVITTDVLPGKQWKGWVKRISPSVDKESGTFKVTVGIKDPENKLYPGLFVNAALVVDYHYNATLIPKNALVYESEKAFFYLVKNNIAKKIELDKGFEDAQKVEVNSGATVGDSIVVIGQNALKDGLPVRILKTRTYSWQNTQSELSRK
ncbi:MAG: efflux RND transporter periplasmic adaptor subunit [Calditrichia bacterium]